MCVMSMVMDHGRDQWPGLLPGQPWISPIAFPKSPSDAADPDLSGLIKQIELGKNAAKKAKDDEPGRLPTKSEIEAFLKLVKAAEAYDKRNNEPHCEDPEKIKLLEAIERRLAAIEAALQIETEFAPLPMLYGSSNLPAHLTINGVQVTLGFVVQAAFRDSGLTAEQWNAEDETKREHRLVDAIAALRKEV